MSSITATTERADYRVYGHIGSRCKTVARGLTAEQASEKCAELNAEEKEEQSGWYYTTDANDNPGAK